MSGADFFCIDDILAECQGFQSEFCVEAFNLANLEQSLITLTNQSVEEIASLCSSIKNKGAQEIKEPENEENDPGNRLTNRSLGNTQYSNVLSPISSQAEQTKDEGDAIATFSGFPNNLTKDSKVVLPIWLAGNLAKLKFIKPAKKSMIEDVLHSTLAADPTVVNLREYNSYFYEFSQKILKIHNERPATSQKIIGHALINRFKYIFMLIVHGNSDNDNIVFQSKMANFERQLYEYCKHHSSLMKKWWGNDFPMMLSKQNRHLIKRIHVS